MTAAIEAVCGLDDRPGWRSLQPFARAAVDTLHARPAGLPRLTPRRLFRLFKPSDSPGEDHRLHYIAERLLGDAAAMGLTIVTCRWWDDDYLRGLYLDSHGLIALNPKMPPYMMLPTLAHELVHAAHRDGLSTTWTEARADVIAAHLVVNLRAIRDCRTDTSTPRTMTRTKSSAERVFAAVGDEAARKIDWPD